MIKRITITILLLAGAVVTGYITFNKPAVFCMMAEAVYMQRIGDNVLISPGASDEQKLQCLELVKEARERNTRLWGDVTSDPVILFCTSWDNYYMFGMYRTQAMTRMNFAGEYIILSPSGINPDDVSHEMCHAELYTRVGYSNDKNIPLWFHEGLAMIVCKDYPQDFAGYINEWEQMTKCDPDIIPLERISSEEDFYSSPTRSNLAYWRSGMEVMRWHEKTGQKGLLELVKQLKAGRDFKAVYSESEEHLN